MNATDAHDTTSGVDQGVPYAHCLCGWTAHQPASYDEAISDAADHITRMFQARAELVETMIEHLTVFGENLQLPCPRELSVTLCDDRLMLLQLAEAFNVPTPVDDVFEVRGLRVGHTTTEKVRAFTATQSYAGSVTA